MRFFTAMAEVAPHKARHMRVLMARWMLVIAIAYTVLFSGDWPAPLWPNQLFVFAVVLSNAALTWLLAQGHTWKNLRIVITGVDVAVVTLAILVSGSASADFYLFYFAVLMLAAVTHRLVAVMALSTLVCVGYGVLLYAEVGANLWRDPSMLIRIPFLYGVAIFFGTVAHETATEFDHLRALTDIGRLSMTGSYPGSTLYEICRRVQDVARVDRCSIVLFEPGGTLGYLAATSDSDELNVVVMAMDRYPELRVAYESGQVTVFGPTEPDELWEKVKKNLPEDNPFTFFMLVPVQWGDHIVGAFYLRGSDPQIGFDESDLNFYFAGAVMLAGFVYHHDVLGQLRAQGRKDSLTGLLNFHGFREEADRAIQALGTTAGPISLLVASVHQPDADWEKTGTEGGGVLRQISRRLVAALPEEALVGKHGADEFVALVRASKGQTVGMIRNLIDYVESGAEELPKGTFVAAGVGGFPDDGEDIDLLVENAGLARRLAQDSGHNQISTPESLDRTEGYGRVVGDTAAPAEEAAPAVQPHPPRVEAPEPRPAQAAATGMPQKMLGLRDESLDSPRLLRAFAEVVDTYESKNPHIKGHSRGVAELSGRLATAMELGERQILAIEVAGLVHDLGKLWTPEEVFKPDGKISDEEREAIEQAPVLAAQALEAFPALGPVVPIVRHHQERWDGGGYPEGLAGDEIPVGSQIVGICSVYRTLMTPRAYRPGLEEEQAREVIQRGAGRQWNPDVAKTFIEQVMGKESMAGVAGREPPKTAGAEAAAGAEVTST